MKYKAYITDSDKIFWTKNSVDKPRISFFNTLMYNIQWKPLGVITPNFINQFNGSITVDKDNYTYLKLVANEGEDNEEIKYFSIDSVSRVLSNGFVVDITLDVFTTYVLKLYSKLEDKPIKVNRTSAYCFLKESLYSQLLKDDLIPLPFKPTNYKFKNELYECSLTSQDYKGNRQYIYNAFNDNSWELVNSSTPITKISEIVIKNNNNGYVYDNVIFDVFQDNNGDWFFLPIFGECTQLTGVGGNTDLRDWIFLKTSLNGYTCYCWNSLPFTNKIKDNTFWANKYVGRYIIPNWVRLIQDFGVAIVVKTNNEIDGINIYKCIYMVKIQNDILSTYSEKNEYFDFSKLTTNEFNQSSNLINSYVYSKITQMSDEIVFNFNNSLINIDKWNYAYNISCPDISKVGLFINYNLPETPISFLFNTIKGCSWYNINLPTVNKLSSFEVLPSNTNVYNQYLASVQSQQNTSVAVSAQQMFMGMFRSAYSGAAQMLNAVGQLGNNPMFAAGGMVNAVGSTVSGMLNSVFQYQNTKKQIEAKNADVLRASTANNINTTSEFSNINNSTVGKKRYQSTRKISLYEINGIIANGNFNLLNSGIYNKIVWESGYLINNVVILNKLKEKYIIDFDDDGVNIFVYWDIEVPVEYIKQSYPNYNNELITAIEMSINNPVRMWKKQPDYNANLMIGWKYKR